MRGRGRPCPSPNCWLTCARCAGQARAVVAIDGRSAGGKSTLAARLAEGLGAAVVHTDDVAWWHDFFACDDLLIRGVLEPYVAGDAAHFRPPAWEERGREGAITVSADSRVVLIEGVGSSRRSLVPYLSAAVGGAIRLAAGRGARHRTRHPDRTARSQRGQALYGDVDSVDAFTE